MIELLVRTKINKINFKSKKKMFKFFLFRTLCVVTQPGEVIKQADIKCIPSEGMPTHRKESFQEFKILLHSSAVLKMTKIFLTKL